MNASSATPSQTEPRAEHHRIPSHHPGLMLGVSHLPPADARGDGKPSVVLYVHGATFPSALSVGYRFDGRSWRDELAASGFDVWALDFHGFGTASDPHPGMFGGADGQGPPGRAEDASLQVEAAVRFICRYHAVDRVSIIAHSQGTMVAGRFAGRCPKLVDRLVFFAPVTWRAGQGEVPRLPAWRDITVQAQWDRFTADTPKGEPAVLLDRHFQAWGESFLASDPQSHGRTPPAVRVPLGPLQDIAAAWAGALAYDPALIQAPIGIFRGEWDSMCTDADARWLWDALSASPLKRDVTFSRAGHLMHLEEGRYALYRETLAFLQGRDEAPAASGDAK